MKTGRPAIPTKLKQLRGNPGGRPLNKQEPKVKLLTELPDAPEFLDDIAADEWRRVGSELVALGLFTTVDRAAFIAYCLCYSRIATIEQMLKSGETTLVCYGAEGGAFINPLMNIQSGALKQMRAYLTGFGMDPSSRTRIKVPDAPKEDPFENFLARGGLRSLPKVKK